MIPWASNSLSPVLIHFIAPHGKLYQRLLKLEQLLGSIPPLLTAQQHPSASETQHGIPAHEWPNVVRLASEHHEPVRQVVAEYGVSHETVRRVVRAARRLRSCLLECLCFQGLDIIYLDDGNCLVLIYTYPWSRVSESST